MKFQNLYYYNKVLKNLLFIIKKLQQNQYILNDYKQFSKILV